MNGTDKAPSGFWRPAASVFLVSCSSIALQLDLIRILSFAHWHHFTFFVISTALLGYGTSGIVLLLTGRRWRRRYESLFFWCSLLTVAVGLPALLVALALPIDSQSLLEGAGQLFPFLGCTLLILVPFFLAGAAVGTSLMQFPKFSSVLYGASMLGTAVGGLFAVGSMFFLPEEQLLPVACVPAIAAAWFWARSNTRLRLWAMIAGTAVLGLGMWKPPEVFVEPFKSLALMRRWEAQGDARRLLTAHGPRGRLDVFESPLLHFTLFAGVNATAPPPTQLVILRDGSAVGTVFRIHSAEEASILDQTLGSVAYRLQTHPRVLLLSETGGTNVWLARRFGASRITIVQADPEILRLMRGPLRTVSGSVFSGDDVDVVREEPRLFLERAGNHYDVIQLVSAEEMAADSRGAGGLQEDYLLTVEGLTAAWQALTPQGILSISRGIQTPPRDSLKLLSMIQAVLRRKGITEAAPHIVLLQNYLADTILLFRSPAGPERMRRLHEIAPLLALDIRYPASGQGSFDSLQPHFPSLQEAVVRLLGPGAQAFAGSWVYDIRPSTDDRPYFRDFFRLRTVSWLKEVYADQWYQNVELGFAILLLLTLLILTLSFLLTILPVVIHWRRAVFDLRAEGGGFRLSHTLLYFCAIGVGFMGFEIVAISKATLVLGDPLYAATTAIASVLLGAGLGSIAAARVEGRAEWLIPFAAAGVVLYGLLLLLATSAGIPFLFGAPLWARVLMTILALLPLSVFLGFFFPLGLVLARRASEMLVPWAWGVNGFASVAAPPALTALAMATGHRYVILVSLLCYSAVGLMTRLTFRKASPWPGSATQDRGPSDKTG